MNNQPQIATPESEDIFKAKMREIEIQEKERATQRKAYSLGLDYINLDKFPISPDALILIPKEDALKLKAVCFLKTEKEIRIGTVNSSSKDLDKVIEGIRAEENCNLKVYLISEYSFSQTFKLYDKIPKIRKSVKGVEIAKEDLEKFKKKIKDFKDLDKELQRCSATDFMALILATALKSDASDIHLEVGEDDVKARFRVDGVLHQVSSMAKKNWAQIISRIKLISSLKINVNRKPQDGRFGIFLDDEELDVRVSTLPANYGESVVIRLFRSSAANLSFDDLGLRGKVYEELKEQIQRPNGMIITTGPTGSGKTTTLYAVLNKINSPDIKIITLEDPVEYKLSGIIQSQVDPEKNYTFANGLKSILRQDPDVIMVGEIRDLETAEIAIQAALTGHLVVSTLHTNDSAGAIPRLLALGAKPFLIAPALNAVLGQRLVRRLCPKCKKETKLDKENLEKVKNTLGSIPASANIKVDLDKLKFYQSKGCPECQGLGYKGRIGIFEVFIIDSETEKIILKSEISEYKTKEIALKKGMITMAQDGLLKALDGITSVDEVFRVTE